ncbi:MAG: hypothetical protein WD944_07620 [Steroidobacteraceae bacterium]
MTIRSVPHGVNLSPLRALEQFSSFSATLVAGQLRVAIFSHALWRLEIVGFATVVSGFFVNLLNEPNGDTADPASIDDACAAQLALPPFDIAAGTD